LYGCIFSEAEVARLRSEREAMQDKINRQEAFMKRKMMKDRQQKMMGPGGVLSSPPPPAAADLPVPPKRPPLDSNHHHYYHPPMPSPSSTTSTPTTCRAGAGDKENYQVSSPYLARKNLAAEYAPAAQPKPRAASPYSITKPSPPSSAKPRDLSATRAR